MAYRIRYLPSGHVFIEPKNNCDRLVDALLKTEYDEEFCVAAIFDEGFISRLMEAGFLVMSAALTEDREEPFYILLPKLHLVRSVLFFPDLRIKKSIRPFLPRYELRVDTDFDLVLDKCVQAHGDAWLTPPLVEILKSLHKRNDTRSKPVSFAVYRNGELKAGEFGVVTGRVYTSYSGYHDESNAGTVQMILMAQWLDKAGFDFLDFGMPLDYKTGLGAQEVSPRYFVELFRAARKLRPLRDGFL
jgi:Leu/Phe-tRNA-protein transferase